MAKVLNYECLTKVLGPRAREQFERRCRGPLTIKRSVFPRPSAATRALVRLGQFGRRTSLVRPARTKKTKNKKKESETENKIAISNAIVHLAGGG